MSRAFTLIELLIVMAVLIIIAGLSSVYLVSFSKNVGGTDGRAILKQTYNTSRSNSMANLDDTSWGLHLESGRVVVFPGATYNSSEPKNIYKVLPSHTTLAWTVTGGGSDIIFNKNSSVTVNSATLTLNSTEASTVTLNINSEGRIE